MLGSACLTSETSKLKERLHLCTPVPQWHPRNSTLFVSIFDQYTFDISRNFIQKAVNTAPQARQPRQTNDAPRAQKATSVRVLLKPTSTSSKNNIFNQALHCIRSQADMESPQHCGETHLQSQVCHNSLDQGMGSTRTCLQHTWYGID
jgi:hypothetical protein